jgi:ABC-2 type transport system ATP-binding protein
MSAVQTTITEQTMPAMVNTELHVEQIETAIKVRALTKTYREFQAVKGIDLDISAGEIFGFIGPDGAGKTSVFQILGGVMQQTSGTAEMYGKPTVDARSFVGYLTQTFSLYQDLSVAENLQYVGQLRMLTRKQIEERGLHYLEMFGMERFTDRLAGSLSGGMKQKLALACALIAEPRILLLDEPTTGVDPVSRREFWDALAGLASNGMTMVVATPYLDEAERCHRVALMYDGEIHETGTPAEIREQLGLRRLEVRASDLSQLGKAEDVLYPIPTIKDVQRFGDRLDLMVADVDRGETITREALLSVGIEVRDFKAGEPTLENAFVAKLREFGGELKTTPFPARRKFRERPADAVAIKAQDLCKWFGSFNAVKNINLEVKYGEIYGLLGANGAGKTTTIKMLCGLIGASSGKMELAGESGRLRSSFVRQRLGYMSQKFSLYDDLTIEENLNFFAGVYQVPRAEREEKKQWVLEISGLDGKGDLMTGSLPGGWKQRVAFGAAVMHEPSVLFLDEPTSGVDPLARRAFWKMINAFADRGVAVLVTTHYLEEAEQCNRLGFMVAGELVAEGTPSGVKAAQGGHLIELITDRPQAAADYLKRTRERWRISLFGDRLHVVVDADPSSETAQLKGELRALDIKVVQAYETAYSLEDVFISIVEKQQAANKKK